jgi:mono/diheme cytochrome c family protein
MGCYNRFIAAMRYYHSSRFLLPAIVLHVVSCSGEPAVSQHAEARYQRFCASCHGVDGRGDGPAAGALTPQPTDLTRSDLSIPELMKVVDGRRTVRAHGTAAMPVWGEVFEQELEGDSRQHRQALREVQAIAEYVRALRTRER